MQALKGLYPGLFVGADDVNTLPLKLRRLLVKVADRLDLGDEVRIVLRRIEPMLDLVWLKVSPILKNAPPLPVRWR